MLDQSLHTIRGLVEIGVQASPACQLQHNLSQNVLAWCRMDHKRLSMKIWDRNLGKNKVLIMWCIAKLLA